MKRVFLIVLDSFGFGEVEDAASYGDKGTIILRSVSESPEFEMSDIRKLSLFRKDTLFQMFGIKPVFRGTSML